MQNYLIVLFIVFNIASCSKPNVITNDSDPAAVKLAEAASSISNAMLQLAKIKAAETGFKNKDLKSSFNKKIPGLRNNISIDWNGPLENLITKLANAGSFKLRILGNSPKIPILISLKQHNEELGTVLQNVDHMAGRSANLTITTNRILELRYAN